MRRKILVGISGGIAVFKVAQLVSNLSKQYEVQVVMTRHAAAFMSPLTFETLSGRPVAVEMFGEAIHHDKVTHIDLAKWADLIILAPATANLIAKMNYGLADDLLSSMLLASRCPILLCPAMNSYMLDHPATQHNLHMLSSRGIHIMESEAGLLACGDFGSGKLPPVEHIQAEAERIMAGEAVARRQDMAGLKLVVTAGPTIEALDPVRFLTNHSTGKMGYCLAETAVARGAKVTLISGPTALQPPAGVAFVTIQSAQEMFQAVQESWPQADIMVKAAAVADYRPANTAEHKIKKTADDLTVTLIRNPDILAWAGAHKREGQLLCGFAMETENLLQNARAKLEKKGADMIVANSLLQDGAGFAVDTNIVTLIESDRQTSLPKMSKRELAHRIWDRLLELRKD